MRGFKRIAGLVAVVAAVAAAAHLMLELTSYSGDGQRALESTIQEVARRWPRIGHVAPAEVERRLSEGNVVVFDTRSLAEYAVSHLPGAIRVAPDMDTATFLERYGGAVAGKSAVFYCSVGMRSSQLAAHVAEGLKARGAVAVDDMAGGIFAWHGEDRPLVDAAGATDFVHPYDSTWGRLLGRPQLARSTPRN